MYCFLAPCLSAAAPIIASFHLDLTPSHNLSSSLDPGNFQILPSHKALYFTLYLICSALWYWHNKNVFYVYTYAIIV